MTDMEVPQAAIAAAASRLYEVQWTGHPTEGQFVGERMDLCGAAARFALEAALPHLLTEVKSMCETATEVALALGRQEALAEVANEMGVEQDDERLRYVTVQIDRETYAQLLAAKEGK